MIDDQLVIADLSERNPNVFYELAIRHALRKPLVQLIRRGEAIPFDVAGMRMVQVDHQDLDSVAEAKEEIVKQIRAIEADPTKVQSPISAAVNLESLRRSEKPQDQFLAELAASVAEIRAAVARLKTPSPTILGFPFHVGSRNTYGTVDDVGKSSQKHWLIEDLNIGDDNLIVIGPTRGKAQRAAETSELCYCGSGRVYSDCHGKD